MIIAVPKKKRKAAYSSLICSLCFFPFAGNINVLAFLGGIIFILVAVIIFITVICFASRGRNRRANSRNYTKEDRKHKDKIIGRDSGGNAGGKNTEIIFHFKFGTPKFNSILLSFRST